MNFSLLKTRKSGKSTKKSTRSHHQVKEGKCGLEAESVRALGPLRSLRSKKKLAAESRHETHFLSNEEKEKWIENYVERESAVARKGVPDAETVIMQEVKDITTTESTGGTTRKPVTRFEEMLNAIWDSLGNLATSDDEQDGEDEEDDKEDTKLRKLSGDEPGWVMGTISKKVQYCMESCWQKQMSLAELTQPGWGDAANYLHPSDTRYGTAELKVLVVVQHQIDTFAATPSPTILGEHMQTPEIVSGQSQMRVMTSEPGSSQIRLGSEKPLSHKIIPHIRVSRNQIWHRSTMRSLLTS